MGTKRLAILFLFSVILAFTSGYFSSNLVESKMVIESDEIFNYITKAFDEYYYYDIDSDDIYDAFISSMTAAVDKYAELNNDPYTKIEAFSNFIASSNVESYIGMGIDYYFENDFTIRVTDVNLTSDLYAKLFPSDLIIGVLIDNEPIYFRELSSTDEVLSYLDGKLLESKDLIVKNVLGEDDIVTFSYQEILTPSTYHIDMNLNDIYYLKIDQFNGYEQGVSVGTNYVFNELLNSLEQDFLIDDSKTLIIDLRNNPGGAITALNNKGTSLNPGVTQVLLPYSLSQPIFTMVDRNDVTSYYYGGLSELKPYDIKVLVNENSASASEVLAASLHSYGYELYGNYTYGKGVYQDTIYLNDIRNVRYYLTYTAGIWNYSDDFNVSTKPLPVNIINQDGYYNLNMPVFDHIVTYDDVDQSLIDYQKFLNIYFNLDEGSMIRTDGYFDALTQNYILMYQNENELPQTGQIDLATSKAIYLDFKTYTNDISYDIQLQTLIRIIRGEND